MSSDTERASEAAPAAKKPGAPRLQYLGILTLGAGLFLLCVTLMNTVAPLPFAILGLAVLLLTVDWLRRNA